MRRVFLINTRKYFLLMLRSERSERLEARTTLFAFVHVP